MSLRAGYGKYAKASVHVERGVSRPAAILRVAEDLERRGAKILELFEKLESPRGEATLPIHYYLGDEECFAEVEAGPWNADASERVLKTAAVLRGSERSDARMDLFCSHPAPGDLRFFVSRAPAALLQLDLHPDEDDASPEALAERFRVAAGNRWGVDLDYDPGCLRLMEDLLLAVFHDEESYEPTPPISEPFVRGLGCYIGELARRNAGNSKTPGLWRDNAGRGEPHVLQLGALTLDPLGRARAFLHTGEEDSIARYVRRILEN